MPVIEVSVPRIHRTFLAIEVLEILGQYRDGLTLEKTQAWLDNEDNMAFLNREGSLGMLEFSSKGLYDSHHFHDQAVRGRKALRASKDMISFAFNTHPEIEIMRGRTPLNRQDARWAARKLGFKSLGVLPELTPACELFILTRKDYQEWEVS